jgi:hypothetical protein
MSSSLLTIMISSGGEIVEIYQLSYNFGLGGCNVAQVSIIWQTRVINFCFVIRRNPNEGITIRLVQFLRWRHKIIASGFGMI